MGIKATVGGRAVEVDGYDLAAVAGVVLVVVGLAFIAWPLALVGAGGGLMAFGIQGATWASSERS